MTTRTGDMAPSFALPAKPGDTIDVGALFCTTPVVLLFFPLAFSSVCTAELCSVRDDWAAWADLDARVFGISVDSPFVTERFRSDLELPFPILSDFNRTVTRAYDVLHEDLMGLEGVAQRACFVIDRAGRIVFDWVTDDPGQSPDLESVRGALATIERV